MDRRKRTARTVALMSLFSMTDTQENVPVASFDGDGSDLISLIVGIEPIQDLHGYDSPWPAGGGKNLLTALPSPGTTVWFCEPDGFLFKANQTYCFSIGDDATVGSYSIYAADKTTQLAYASSYRKVTYTPTVDTVGYPRLYAGEGVSQEAINSAQLELGNNRTTFAPYSNICPISGWTGANIHVSPTTDAEDGETYSIAFPSSAGTVYGGTLDVVTGVLTVDRANIASYNGEPLPSTWISDRDVYAVGTMPTTGAQVVYKLATPIVIDLTPTEINTLLGTNNIWANTGEIKYIEYNL